jgi:hypothetical protein
VVVLAVLFFARLLYINNPSIRSIAKIPAAITSEKHNPEFIGPILISKTQKQYFNDLQNFFNKNTSIKDKIFIFSDEPMLYFLLNRDVASKYVLPYLAVLKPDREAIVLELKKNTPKYILYNMDVWSVDDINNIIRLPEVSRFVFSNYTLVKTIDGEGIYEINQK